MHTYVHTHTEALQLKPNMWGTSVFNITTVSFADTSIFLFFFLSIFLFFFLCFDSFLSLLLLASTHEETKVLLCKRRLIFFSYNAENSHLFLNTLVMKVMKTENIYIYIFYVMYVYLS